MTDRKQINKYYPPDYDPSKGSLNTQLGQHPLRKRAAKLASEGILVVRFELPVNAWCTHCNKHIGKGVRYNAEKKKAGMYYSTTIWEFTMKCHLCMGKMVIRTDPASSQYIFVSGLRKKEESFSAAANETIELLDDEDRARMESDALFRLEHQEADKRAAAESHDRLSKLYNLSSRMNDDFSMNQAARRIFRAEKAERKQRVEEGRAKGFGFGLLPATERDQQISNRIEFGRKDNKLLQQQAVLHRLKKKATGIFDFVTSKPAVPSSSSSAPSRLRALDRALAHGVDVKSLAPLSSDLPSTASVTIAPPSGVAATATLKIVKKRKENGEQDSEGKEKSKRRKSQEGTQKIDETTTATPVSYSVGSSTQSVEASFIASGSVVVDDSNSLLALAAYDSEPD